MDLLNSHSDPKDLKRSIRNKYKRRLNNLSRVLNDFILHAEDRLDQKRAGNIKNKKETEELIQICTKLKNQISSLPKSPSKKKKEEDLSGILKSLNLNPDDYPNIES